MASSLGDGFGYGKGWIGLVFGLERVEWLLKGGGNPKGSRRVIVVKIVLSNPCHNLFFAFFTFFQSLA